jgi:alpha-beta hydrolase superfamily lysophospholipase
MIATTSEVEKPAIVIVPGSCAPPAFYASVADRLREEGYETIVGALPTASREPPAPAATFEDDVAAFHAIVEELADQNKDVVIVTHSYGGVVGTECVNGLAKTDRGAAGKKGGVVQLVYFSSVVPVEGQSLQDAMADQLPDYFTIEVS